MYSYRSMKIRLLTQLTCKISSFHCGVVEAFAILGWYAAFIGSCLATFRDSLFVPSSKTSQSKNNDWPLKMGRIGSPETSVNNYPRMLRNIPQEQGHSWHVRRRKKYKINAFEIESLFKIISVIASLVIVWPCQFKLFVSAQFVV